MANYGNTFDARTVSYGHARKVFREIRHRFPAGGTCSNISDWTDDGKIPSGTPVAFDNSTNTFQAFTDAQITVSDADTLGINGFLQEDILVADENTVGTGTVIYGAEIYEFMYADEVLTILQASTKLPQIVWVR